MYGKCDVVILIFFALSARNSISAFVSSSKESTRDVLFFVDLSITFGRISSILVSASSSMLFFNTLKLVIYLKIPFCNSCNFIIGKPSQRATSCNFHIVLMIEISVIHFHHSRIEYTLFKSDLPELYILSWRFCTFSF